jgi:methanogenic corrinoid protein MtbC1
MQFHISNVKELIDQVRSSAMGPRVKILVGGYPFNIDRNLWQKVGADGCGRNAQEAVELAKRLALEVKNEA